MISAIFQLYSDDFKDPIFRI